MRSERGQATVEWICLVLLVAVALGALTRLAPSADGRELAASLAHSVTGTPGTRHPQVSSPKRLPATIPVSVRTGAVALPLRRTPPLPPVLRRAGRGAGAVWRRAWFACLVYKRIRYGVRHPESRLPGYSFSPRVGLRIANGCLSPVDLLQGWTFLGGNG